MVLSNTVVNNIRFTANRTNVHRTHADMFGPEDVGVNIYTPIPDYMLLSVTGGVRDQHRDGDRLLLPSQHLRDSPTT